MQHQALGSAFQAWLCRTQQRRRQLYTRAHMHAIIRMEAGTDACQAHTDAFRYGRREHTHARSHAGCMHARTAPHCTAPHCTAPHRTRLRRHVHIRATDLRRTCACTRTRLCAQVRRQKDDPADAEPGAGRCVPSLAGPHAAVPSPALRRRKDDPADAGSIECSIERSIECSMACSLQHRDGCAALDSWQTALSTRRRAERAARHWVQRNLASGFDRLRDLHAYE